MYYVVYTESVVLGWVQKNNAHVVVFLLLGWGWVGGLGWILKREKNLEDMLTFI